MKAFKFLLTICLAVTFNIASAQLCTQDDRFTNSEYFSNNQIDSLKNVNYGHALNYKGESVSLDMDIYFPINSADKMAKRPFILLIHGGGWKGGSREGYAYHSKEFAKRGFVTATMSYRLGFEESSEEFMKAIYRSQQDVEAALRYLATRSEDLKIDSSWIFLGGSSAGAIASLLTAYASQEEWGMVSPVFETKLGPLDSSGNDIKQTLQVRGIYNHMGSVQPIVLDVEDLIPTVSFHGELDKAVPIDASNKGFGSRAIHNMLNEAGVCNDLTIVPEGGHNIYIQEEGADFMIDKVACFFRSLFCDTCTSFVASEDVPASCSK